jgi:uncharacterized protein DUF4286
MIFYEVTLQVDPSRAAALEHHMRQQHIPAILRTGCFRRIHFDRASPTRFRTSYEAASALDLERYLHDHAPTFRDEFQREFPDGVAVTRETWVQQQVWSDG